MLLNLGCGSQTVVGAVNVDRVAGPGVTAVLDLDRLPWPWPDGTFAAAWALDLFEHVADPLAFMTELHRVLQPGARVRVRTTCWETRQSFTDPTHRRFCTPDTFAFWDPSTWQAQKYPQYAQGRHFRVLHAERSGEELEFALERLP